MDFSSMVNNAKQGADMGGQQGINSSGSGLASIGAVSALSSVANSFINTQRSKNVYKFNSAMQGIQARRARLAADKTIADIRKKASSIYSSQKTGYAKAGIAMTGSAIDVAVASQKEAELDIIFEDINADLIGSSYDMASGIYKGQAKSASFDFAQDTMKTVLTVGRKKYERG